jgi:hypothetical protein
MVEIPPRSVYIVHYVLYVLVCLARIEGLGATEVRLVITLSMMAGKRAQNSFFLHLRDLSHSSYVFFPPVPRMVLIGRLAVSTYTYIDG